MMLSDKAQPVYDQYAIRSSINKRVVRVDAAAQNKVAKCKGK